MATQGSWIAGDEGHVQEHNRVYADLITRVEFANTLESLSYASPIIVGVEHPLDEDVFWVDTGTVDVDGNIAIKYYDQSDLIWKQLGVGTPGVKGDKGDKGDQGESGAEVSFGSSTPAVPTIGDLWLDTSA
jgi:hypothetical protein